MLNDLNYLRDRDPQGRLGSLEQGLADLTSAAATAGLALPDDIRRVVIPDTEPSIREGCHLWLGSASGLDTDVVAVDNLMSAANKQSLLLLPGAELPGCDLADITGEFAAVVSTGRFGDGVSIHQLRLPAATDHRQSVFTILTALTVLEESLGGLAVGSAAAWRGLGEQAAAFSAVSPTADNLAKQLAYEIIGKTPVIYAAETFWPLACKWKTDLNAVARQLAWAGKWSPAGCELDGWRKPDR